jgi:hypothetical protein
VCFSDECVIGFVLGFGGYPVEKAVENVKKASTKTGPLSVTCAFRASIAEMTGAGRARIRGERSSSCEL